MVERVPEELWMEVYNIVQEVVIKAIPKKKTFRKAKWLSKEALQTAKKRKCVKGKRERERYTQMNAAFQGRARRDKKHFLSEKCKKKKKQRKTTGWEGQRSLQENWRHQGNISCKDRHNKGQKQQDLIEAEEIKNKWQEYTEELYKKALYDPHNHNGMVPHLEPDILECEVKWAIGNITVNKASGGDGMPTELF